MNRYLLGGIVLLLCMILILILQNNSVYSRWGGCSAEKFEDTPPTLHPGEMFKKLRGLLDKYDKPEVWQHAMDVHTKTPTELARMNLT
jgi:hypothetical protein